MEHTTTCPACDLAMEKATCSRQLFFRGMACPVEYECLACPGCGLTAGTREQTATIQR